MTIDVFQDKTILSYYDCFLNLRTAKPIKLKARIARVDGSDTDVGVGSGFTCVLINPIRF